MASPLWVQGNSRQENRTGCGTGVPNRGRRSHVKGMKMRRKRLMAGLGLGAVLAAGVLLAPALQAQGSRAMRAAERQAPVSTAGIGVFTPAAADPKLAAVLARSGLPESSFRFTPSESRSGSNRAITVAVRARSTRSARTAERAAAGAIALPTVSLAPIAYNLGVSVGWRRFAVSGEMTKVDLVSQPGGREQADIGISYTGKRASGRLRARRRSPAGECARAGRRRSELFDRCRRLLFADAQPRCDRGRALQDRARPPAAPDRRASRQPGGLCGHRLPLLTRPGVDSSPAVDAQPARAGRVHHRRARSPEPSGPRSAASAASGRACGRRDASASRRPARRTARRRPRESPRRPRAGRARGKVRRPRAGVARPCTPISPRSRAAPARTSTSRRRRATLAISANSARRSPGGSE